MAETGFVRFPGSLDPAAQEFVPRNPIHNPNQLTFFGPPPSPHIYFPYPPISEVVPYAVHFSAPATYVSAAHSVLLQSAAATRAVLLSSVPSDVTEGVVKREVEGFGEVRWVQMERACDGIVTVHFYDLRHAERALREFREQYMQHQTELRNHYAAVSSMTNTPPLHQSPLPTPPGSGLIASQPVWADFAIPALRAAPDGHNQGTIVIFNLDSAVTTSTLKDTFQAFGPVKELRETPSKKHQRFIEFFDVRDAAKALREMNGEEINGKPIVIEFSRPGGHSRKYLNAVNTTTTPALVSPIINVAPVLSTNGGLSFQTSSKYSPIPPELGGKFSRRSPVVSTVPPRLWTTSSEIRFSSSRNKSNNSSKGIIISSENGSMSSNSRSVESKMAAFNLDGSGDQTDSLRRTRKSSSSNKSCQNPQNPGLMSPKQQQAKSSRGKKGRQAKKLDSRFLIKEDAMEESSSGETRTTVMIKNIPNKYSQKLLLNMLDNHCIHCNEQIIDNHGGDDDVVDSQQPLSSYDFVYLPIDFNNKCNVGYGFVNMTSPQATWRLYKFFHHHHWEVFNSRKICQVTYARVQGLKALKEHFKNSKFPCEMEHYLPVVFSPPRDGRRLTEPLPIVGAPPAKIYNNNNLHPNDDDSIPVSLLLPLPPHHHDQHEHDMDASVSACDSDDSCQNGGVVMEDDDDDDD